MVILTILHISHHPVVTSSPVGFSHAKVQRSSGVKHHYANGSRICPAAFRKSKMAFQPPPRTSTDWVFREIPRPFACLSVLSPLSGLHVKSLPPRKPKGSESREKKKQVQQIKNLKLCTARFSNYRNTGEQGQLPERGHPHAGRR